MILETIIGGIGGGLLRLAPEAFAWLDRKGARKHELSMQDKAFKFEELRGAQKLGEIGATNQMVLDEGGLEALKEAIKGQSTPTGDKFSDRISNTIRPILTYWWCIVLQTTAMIAKFILFTDKGMTSVEAINLIWGPGEMAIVAGMLNFWFLDRVLRKNKGL